MTRWKASGIHVAISASAGLVAAAILLGIWYRPPLFSAAGADSLIALLIGVDLVLGPLITLIVFKSGKPGMRFDLAVIGTLQAAAMAYGMHVMWVSRPVYLVAAVDRFTLVSANDIPEDALAAVRGTRWGELSWRGPVLVGAQLPEDPDERMDLALRAAAGGGDLEQHPHYYVEYAAVAETLRPRARPASTLLRDAAAARHLREALARHGLRADQAVLLPTVARKHDLSMLLRSSDMHPLELLEIDPWNAR